MSPGAQEGVNSGGSDVQHDARIVDTHGFAGPLPAPFVYT